MRIGIDHFLKSNSARPKCFMHGGSMIQGYTMHLKGNLISTSHARKHWMMLFNIVSDSQALVVCLESKDYTQIRNTIMVLTKVCSHRCDKWSFVRFEIAPRFDRLSLFFCRFCRIILKCWTLVKLWKEESIKSAKRRRKRDKIFIL